MAKLHDIVNVIEELKSTQGQVLEHIRQIVDRQTICSCTCHTRDSAKDLDILELRVKELEKNEENKEREIRALKEQLQSVRDKFNNRKLYHVGENLETVRKDLGSRIEQCRSNPSLNENTQTDKTTSSPMVQSENIKDCGSRGDNKITKNATLETRKQKAHQKNESNLKVWTGQKPEIVDNSSGGINLPKFDTQRKSVTQTVTKPNFKKKSLSETLGVRVVEQSEQKMIEFMDWHRAASKEEAQGRLSGLATLEGVFTVVCVDISYSMTQGDAWQQAKKFFQDFTESLQESSRKFGITEESVALVTFGHKTEVLKRLTNDMYSLQLAFDGISLGGPSPMYGGLLHAVAAARASLCSGGANVNGIPVATKIVLITDGYPTDTNLVGGPDELTSSKVHETNTRILSTLNSMEDVFDVFCVPVGNANMEFIREMTSVADGKMITYKDGWNVGQRLRKTLSAGILPSFHPAFKEGSDEEDIQDILERAQRRVESKETVKRTHCYNEIKTDRLPEIGSRVRRGPDWKWDDQDCSGPGTVIGQAPNERQIWIEWDGNENINVYNYHAAEGFDVLIEDVPRWPKPDGRLAVGCRVKPGMDWKNNIKNVKGTDTGVVIKMVSSDKVRVRWNNKEKGDYSYGMDDIFEVEFSPPERTVKESEAANHVAESTGAQGHTSTSQEDQYYVPQSQISQPRKNNAKAKFRNKNMN